MAVNPVISDLWLWRTGCLPAGKLRNYQYLLARDELLRAERFVRPEESERYLFNRATLRQVLAPYLGITPGEVSFSYGPHGKPLLATPPLARVLAFNLSHSADLSALAVTNQSEVGVDLEAVRDVSHRDSLAEKVFSTAERTELGATLSAEAFLRHWTAKEAVLKFTGAGLTAPLTTWSAPRPTAEPQELTAPVTCWLSELALPTGYVGAVASGVPGDFAIRWVVGTKSEE